MQEKSPFRLLDSIQLDTAPRWRLVPNWLGLIGGRPYSGPAFLQQDLEGNILDIIQAL